MGTTKIRFFKMLLAALVLAAAVAAHAQVTWQPVTIDGREYLTLSNVAEFYQLQNVAPSEGQHVVFSDGRSRLETFTNPRELYVNGVKEWLSFPMVCRDGQMLITRFDLAKMVEPSLRPTMIGNLEPFQTVVLDAGHGGQDGGGHTTTGLEKDYTLDVIKDLKQSLEAKGLQVVLTRSEDQYLALEQRADLANTVPNAVFVSVHFNSGDSTASGLEVFAMTPRGASSTSDTSVNADQFLQMPGNDFDEASLALANSVHHALLGNLDTADRGVKRARFAVLRLTHAPAILIEGGFMTSGIDSQEITAPAWRQQLADSIARGVRSYQDLVRYKQPPKLLADYRAEHLMPVGTAALPNGFGSRFALRNLSLRPVSGQRPASRAVTTSPAIRPR